MARIRDVFINASQGFWVLDDKSGAKIKGNSFRSLKFAIIAHRKANNLEWSQGEIEEMIHRQVCQRESPSYCRAINEQTIVQSRAEKGDEWGRRLWTSLHKASLDGSLNLEWLKQWETALPSQGCSCKSHWKQAKKEVPFQPNFEWTWAVHQVVNRMLGRPGVSLEKARSLWSSI